MTDPTEKRNGPVLIEEGDPALAGPAPSPAEAPPPDDTPAAPAAIAVFAPSRGARWLGRLFWIALVGLLGMALTVAAYDFVAALLARNLWLGRAALAFAVVLSAALVALALREMAALARLGAIDTVRRLGARALRDADLKAARTTVDALDDLYARRADLDWARGRVTERRSDALDAETLLTLAEREYLTPLDAAAEAAIARAARNVAAATALIPLAFVDVLAAMLVNLRMLREIAEIYGGRTGTLGSWRLMRAVAAHLVATGAVAVGDDVLGPVLGGGAVAKLSRRFGEGLVNGALTARVGIAAMDICRPLPYGALKRPKTSKLVARALKGFAG
jgi:putative membrane protein